MKNDELALLHQKIDTLTELITEQRKRQEALEDLQRDLIPIANQAVRLTVQQLEDVGPEFRIEDALYLLKRVMRNVPLFIRLMDQVEAVAALSEEMPMLTGKVYRAAVEQLDQLDKKGYFEFAQGGLYIADQIVREFDEEDVRALGDNIVTILKTVRNLTQPEIMTLANHAADAMRQTPIDESNNVSMWSLMRELGDPRMRKGLARMINLVKAMAEQPDGTRNN